jgi:hypothetical protein
MEADAGAGYMNEIDVLLDHLFAAAIKGDAEAAAFLRMFVPWAIEMRVKFLRR